MDIKLIDRWDDIEGNKYFTLCIDDTPRRDFVDVKRSIDEDGWFNYIMDCENGYEVYKEGETNGWRHTSWEEENEIMDFVVEQVKVEREMDEDFEKGNKLDSD